jgi:hypothetical protein
MPGSKHSQNQLSDPHPTGSGLVKAAYNTGRERGASATPAPTVFSPQPNRGVVGQVESMNPNPYGHGSSFTTPNGNLRSDPSSQHTSPHHRNSSSSTHQSNRSQTSSSQYGGSQHQGANLSPNNRVSFAFVNHFCRC